MKRRIAFDQIIASRAEHAAIQADWDRQRNTALAVTSRFENGYDTVLLADEVGMGKTYVGMSVMADYLLQSRKNDRKVLLIVPPSHVLRHKWLEDIVSFNGKYVQGGAHKQMRPLNVGSYWELFRNLHDFDDAGLGAVHPATRGAFLKCLFEWGKARELLGKKPGIWPAVQSVDSGDYLSFISKYSLAALYHFLDTEYAVDKERFQQYFRGLKADDYKPGPLATLLKTFAKQQDRFEPNIFVMSMSALKAPKINESDNQLFSAFALKLLMRRLPDDKELDIVKALEVAHVLPARRGLEHWATYQNRLQQHAGIDLFGLRKVTERVLKREDVNSAWRALRADIRAGDAHDFFRMIRDLVFQEKLAESNFGLAVVDEVHNWKEGAHNATEFARQYAPFIANKLIMSATPFQVKEGELKRVFGFVADQAGQSAAALEAIFEEKSGVIQRCLKASDAFAGAWQALPLGQLDDLGHALLNAGNEREIRALATRIIADGDLGEPVPGFAQALLAYRKAIDAMRRALCPVVIRHTKPRDKRDFRIGQHFHKGHPDGKQRPALYPSQGYANEDAAMVNFIGMRLGQHVSRSVSGEKQAKARLLSGMSSSTAAFLNGASSRKMNGGAHAGYHAMFSEALTMVMHPKVEATVERALDNFRRGRKTLIFCERTQTIKELRKALQAHIDADHAEQRNDSIQRRSLMRRADLVDNLWWLSLGDAAGRSEEFAAMLEKQGGQAEQFVRAHLAAAGVKSSARRIIRLLDIYLLAQAAKQDNSLRERWPHALKLFSGVYTVLSGAGEQGVRVLAACVNGTGVQADHVSVNADDSVDDGTAEVQGVLRAQYRQRQNLWCAEKRPEFHQLLWSLLDSEAARLMQGRGDELPILAFIDIVLELMAGLRRVVLREDLIARYEAAETAGTHFARISAGFATMDVGHNESMLQRTQRFVGGLLGEDGSISHSDKRDSKRKSMWSGIWRAAEHGHVARLEGHTKADARRRLCASFNSPLQPEILICSAIGSEGIDLHRHCADIIHHDLPWNPAKLEQRIGRLDRVNSLANPQRAIPLAIGIPFLANNYDQFQYDLVFSRAQKFEILLGTPTFQHAGVDEELYSDDEALGRVHESEDAEAGEKDEVLRALPDAIVQFLKVDLAASVNPFPQ